MSELRISLIELAVFAYAFVAIVSAVKYAATRNASNDTGLHIFVALMFPIIVLFAIGSTLGKWFKWADSVGGERSL